MSSEQTRENDYKMTTKNGISPEFNNTDNNHQKGGCQNDPTVDDSCKLCNFRWLEKASSFITSKVEKGFYKIGYFIGRYPWAGILIGIAIFLLSLIGTVRWFEETDPSKLWVPQSSRAVTENDISADWFPETFRISSVLIIADDVLDPVVIQNVNDFDIAVKALEVSGKMYSDLCFKAGPDDCLQSSILEIWSFDKAVIDGKNAAEIVTDINTITISPVTGRAIDAANMFGQKTMSGDDITAAKAMTITYFLETSDLFSEEGIEQDWEDKFLDLAEKGIPGTTVHYFATRSFGDIGGGAILRDVSFLFGGYMLVIVFLVITLGQFSCREQKAYMGLLGILCIGMSIGVSFGLASLIGFDYGPLHSVLPFLLLGIGVDDMFVIVAAWDNLPASTKDLPMPERIGQMIQHAGVSILITSMTDIAAFAIGASTIIPALRSFCMFAAFGVLGLFLITLLLFSAVFSLDQRRASDNRNACCCCYRHGEDYEPNQCSQSPISVRVFEKVIAKALSYIPVKIVVLVITATLLGLSIWGVVEIPQDFNPDWFIPDGNYFKDYLDARSEYFPSSGYPSAVYIGPINYYTESQPLLSIPTRLSQVDDVTEDSVDSWYSAHREWLKVTSDGSVTAVLDGDKWPTSEAAYYATLQTYLTGDGKGYASDVNSDDDYASIMSSRIPFRFNLMADSSIRIEAMDAVRETMDELDCAPDSCFAFNTEMLAWEGDKVIKGELFRNLILAFVCVFVVTLLLIANPLTCIFVLMCVMMTVVDVAGMLYFWGVTINTVSTIHLILSVGLAVDYAAHIGHVFMICPGSRKARMERTLREMGTAVFNGGFSTMLAFLPLALSSSYVFFTFFQSFFLVSVFGLFHGLIFLPVILSLLGPSPYLSVLNKANENEEYALNGTANGSPTKEHQKE